MLLHVGLTLATILPRGGRWTNTLCLVFTRNGSWIPSALSRCVCRKLIFIALCISSQVFHSLEACSSLSKSVRLRKFNAKKKQSSLMSCGAVKTVSLMFKLHTSCKLLSSAVRQQDRKGPSVLHQYLVPSVYKSRYMTDRMLTCISATAMPIFPPHV